MDFTKDIYINKDTVYEDSEIVLLYKGHLFSDNLSNEVYISYGYGSKWENQSEIKMKPSTFGYLATINVESGENLQFCFRDNSGNWDNNNSKNYILPIKESEQVLSFKTLENTATNVSVELFGQEQTEKEIEKQDEKELNDILTASVVSSNAVEFTNTQTLENIDKPAIPNNTVFNQVNPNSTEVVKEAVVKVDESVQETAMSFAEITRKAKAESVKAFDNDKVTTGSLYVNSIVNDINSEDENENEQIEEPVTDRSLIEYEAPSLPQKVSSFFSGIFNSCKTAISKLVKLVKTSLNFSEDEDN